MSKKKSNFRIVAEAISSGRLAEVELPNDRIKHRKLSVDEIKEIMIEEFGKAKEVASVEAQEKEKGWGDDALEKEIEWVKKLGLKEFFNIKKK